MTTTRYAVVDIPTVGPHKGKITKVWDFDLHFSDAHVLKKKIANKRLSKWPTVLTDDECKAHPHLEPPELEEPTPAQMAELGIDPKKFAPMSKEQEDELVKRLADELGEVIDPIVEAAKATPDLPAVTKNGHYTAGPPPDGRPVAEHLDELAKGAVALATAPAESLFADMDVETLLRRRVHLQTSIDSLKAVMEPMSRTPEGRAQSPKHWPLELKRMTDELAKIDDALEKVLGKPEDAACVSIGNGFGGDPAKWCFWETEYPEDMVNGPYESEAACRLAVEDFYMKNNPFGSGKTAYVIERVVPYKPKQRTIAGDHSDVPVSEP